VIADTAEIRSAFPALERHEAGRPVAYFDAPGGTQVPRAVADAISDHLLAHNANAGWAFPTSVETAQVVANARSAAADFLGGPRAGVVFGTSMTALTFLFAESFGSTLGPGDEIVVTRLDHRANVDPWMLVAADHGATVRAVPFDPTNGALDMSALDAAIGPRTRLVALGAAANSLGTINDVRVAADLARSHGAVSFVDAVHWAPHLRTDMDFWGCDAVACSPYKFYGPHVGVLCARPELLQSLEAKKLGPAPDDDPARWERGALSFEALAGMIAAIDWLASLAPAACGARNQRLTETFRSLHERGDDLVSRLWAGLDRLPGVTLYGPLPGEPRTPTVAFTTEAIPSAELAGRLAAEHGVFVSHGHFYAPDTVKDLGVPDATGLVRAGCACYTTSEEVDRLVAGVRELLRH
jgi:cysteine desulfurase family protein (TIGR01976 family)